VQIEAGAAISILQALGAPSEVTNGIPPGMTVPPVRLEAHAIWSDRRSRLDCFDPAQALAFTLITDESRNLRYTYDARRRTGVREPLIPANEPGAQWLTAGAANASYDLTLAELRKRDWASVNELGHRELHGLDCRGLSFSVNLSGLLAEAESAGLLTGEGLAAMTPLLSTFNSLGGELWISERHNVLMLAILETTGLTLKLDCSGVEAWSGAESLFFIPDDAMADDNAHLLRGFVRSLRREAAACYR
jgi:hypothetical protein